MTLRDLNIGPVKKIPLFRSDFAAWQAGLKRDPLANDDQNVLNRFLLDRTNNQDGLFYK